MTPIRDVSPAQPTTEAGRYMWEALIELEVEAVDTPEPKYGLNFRQRILAIEAEATERATGAVDVPEADERLRRLATQQQQAPFAKDVLRLLDRLEALR